MERYEVYKGSGVKWLGEIPTTWTCGRIRSVYVLRKELVEDGEPDDLVSVSEYYGVDYRRNRISSSDVLARAESLEGYQLCYPDDLVMNIMLAWKGAQGTSTIKGLVSPSYGVFRPLRGSCPRYYHYLMRTNQYKEYFKSYSSGIIDSRLRLYPEVFLHLNCHVPPLKEQRAIADYLDAKTAEVDALVTDCEREVALLQEYRKAVISEAVTKGLDPDAPMKDSGVEWIGEIPEGWGMSTIGRVGQTSSGATPLRGRDDDYFHDATIPWIRTLDLNGASIFKTSEMITELALEKASCSIMPIDTVCVAMYGGAGTIGKCGMMAIPATTNQAVCSIVCNDSMQPRYLLYYLHAIRPEWMRFAAGTRKDPNISQEIVGRMCVLVPPLDIQVEIASRLDAKTAEIDSLIKAKQTMADKLREYRKSLISEAVTGKFKVPGV